MNPLEEIPRMSFLDITGKWDSPRVPTPAIKLGRSQHWRLQPLFTKADHAAEHSRIGNPGTPTYSYGVEFYDYWVPKITGVCPACAKRMRAPLLCRPQKAASSTTYRSKPDPSTIPLARSRFHPCFGYGCLRLASCLLQLPPTGPPMAPTVMLPS